MYCSYLYDPAAGFALIRSIGMRGSSNAVGQPVQFTALRKLAALPFAPTHILVADHNGHAWKEVDGETGALVRVFVALTDGNFPLSAAASYTRVALSAYAFVQIYDTSAQLVLSISLPSGTSYETMIFREDGSTLVA